MSSVDAARGAAMVFVCLAHFANYYHFMAGATEMGAVLVAIGMVASPTFVTVSGIVAGFMATARKRSFPHFRRKLVDRGVFLLLVGHAVLTVIGAFSGASLAHAYSIGYITDAIAVAIIVGPWLVVTLPQKWRLLLAATIFGLDLCAILFWQPSAASSVLAKHYLVGLLNPADAAVTLPAFPVIPWFAVYLAGTVIGERVGTYYARENRRDGHLLLAKIGFPSFVTGVAAKFILMMLRRNVPNFAQMHSKLMPLLSSYQKYPPGPTYICFYGGAGLLLVAGVLETERRGHLIFLMNQLRQIGQASLFSYLAQSCLYGVILWRLHLPYTRFWPILFVFSLAVLSGTAAVWNSFQGNRYLSVGIGQLLERNALQKSAMRDRQSVSTLPLRGDGAVFQALSFRLRRVVPNAKH